MRSIADALRVRFERLDPAGLELLQMAAVLGEPWTASELAVAGGHDRARVDGVVRDAIDAQVVRRSRDGLWFTHPLLRTELLDDLDDDHVRALHRSVADGLLGTGVAGDAELVRAPIICSAAGRPPGPGPWTAWCGRRGRSVPPGGAGDRPLGGVAADGAVPRGGRRLGGQR